MTAPSIALATLRADPLARLRQAEDGVHLDPKPEEQQVFDLARSLRAEGLSLKAICCRLQAEGHLPRSGSTWHPMTISRICG